MGVPCDQWQLTDVNRDYKVDGRLYVVGLQVCTLHVFYVDVVQSLQLFKHRAAIKGAHAL